MKVIIAGSRSITRDPTRIENIVLMAENAFGEPMTELVCGMAPRGIDSCALDWREHHNVTFKSKVGLKPFPADWDGFRRKFGTHKGAGHARNKQMAEYADALILIWDGESPGSSSMKDFALERGLPIFEVIVKKKKTRIRKPI